MTSPYAALRAAYKHKGEPVEAALSLAAAGWNVFPLVKGGKRPATGHGFKAASADPSTVEGMWSGHNRECGIGVIPADNDAVVMDIDPKHTQHLSLIHI